MSGGSSITDALFGSSPSAEASSGLDFTPQRRSKPGTFTAKRAVVVATKSKTAVSHAAESGGEGRRRQRDTSLTEAEAAPSAAANKRRRTESALGDEQSGGASSSANSRLPAATLAARKKLPKKRHLSHRSDDHEDEDERTVFVGNLPNTVLKKQVSKIFKDCGAIEAVRIRSQVLAHVADGDKKRGRAVRILRGELDKTGDHAAHAYVLFAQRSPQVQKALQLNGLVFQGRHIIVTKEDPASKAFPPQTSVFIGNIAFATSDEMVWSFFDERGLPVKRVRIIRDPQSGQGKGFGYVEFQTSSVVKKAVKLRGEVLNGREIRICHVQKSTDPRIGQMQRRTKRKLVASTAVASGAPSAAESRRAEQSSSMSVKKALDLVEETPAWMGLVTNPRKKLARDLRPLVEPRKPKDRATTRGPNAAKKGPAPQAKRKATEE
jgi:nucleolar protein 12